MFKAKQFNLYEYNLKGDVEQVYSQLYSTTAMKQVLLYAFVEKILY